MCFLERSEKFPRDSKQRVRINHDKLSVGVRNTECLLYIVNISETGDTFSISENGMLSTLQRLDREKKSSYVLTVFAKDHGIPQKSSNQTVRVAVLDVNDNKPLFCEENKCSEEVKEINRPIVGEAPFGSVVALLVAEDKDLGNNGTVHYSITGDKVKTQFFEINNNTGVVTLKLPVKISQLVALDIISENDTDNATLTITIVATDAGTPEPKSNNLSLVVSVKEINDDAPVFNNQLFSFNILENSTIGKKHTAFYLIRLITPCSPADQNNFVLQTV